MRTLIDLPEAEMRRLDAFAAARGWSRAEAVRQAVAALLEREAAAERAADAAAFDAVFGMWKDRDMDGLAYQRALRAEWDRPWDDQSDTVADRPASAA